MDIPVEIAASLSDLMHELRVMLEQHIEWCSFYTVYDDVNFGQRLLCNKCGHTMPEGGYVHTDECPAKKLGDLWSKTYKTQMQCARVLIFNTTPKAPVETIENEECHPL